jgi:hypothetical protein
MAAARPPNILVTGTPGTGAWCRCGCAARCVDRARLRAPPPCTHACCCAAHALRGPRSHTRTICPGKTTTAQLVAEASGLRYINVGDWVKEQELHSGWDEEHQALIIDEDKVGWVGCAVVRVSCAAWSPGAWAACSSSAAGPLARCVLMPPAPAPSAQAPNATALACRTMAARWWMRWRTWCQRAAASWTTTAASSSRSGACIARACPQRAHASTADMHAHQALQVVARRASSARHLLSQLKQHTRLYCHGALHHTQVV